jgi:hypothetical protein
LRLSVFALAIVMFMYGRDQIVVICIGAILQKRKPNTRGEAKAAAARKWRGEKGVRVRHRTGA